MATLSSPFKSVLDSVGPQHEKALKQAFYNTAAIIFVLLSTVIGISAYFVLEIFLRPLIWAALCGTFLFPFKKASTRLVRSWLKDMEEKKTPFVVGICFLPFQGLSRSADSLGTAIRTNLKLLIASFLLVPLLYYLVVFHPFYQIFSGIQLITNVLGKFLGFFNYPIAVWTTFIGYVLLILFFKNPNNGSNGEATNYSILKYISVCVWVFMLFHFASLAGPWKVPMALLFFILIILGIIGEKKSQTKGTSGSMVHTHSTKTFSVKDIVDGLLVLFGISTVKANSGVEDDTPSEAGLYSVNEKIETDVASLPPDVTELPNPNVEMLKSEEQTPKLTKKKILNQTKHNRTKKYSKRKRIGKSDPYFIALFWLFGLSRIWMHSWLLHLIPILSVIYLLKFLFTNTGLDMMIYQKFQPLVDHVWQKYTEKEDIIFPGPVKGVVFMMHAGDQKLICWMNSSLDKVMTIIMILCLGIATLLGAAFFGVQFHHESSYLVTVVTDVVNRTVISNQDYLRLLNLNDTEIRKTFDQAVHSAYIVGRKKMVGFVTSSLPDTGGGNDTRFMEEQITQFLDQLYDSWTGKVSVEKSNIEIESDTSGTTNEPTKSLLSKQWTKLTKFLYGRDLSNLLNILKDNMDTLRSVLDSIWAILKGNVNIFFTVVTHVFSIILFSGTYLLNAAISVIVFSTTLIYLLSASSENYMLVDLFTGVSMGTRLGESINVAIQDVFGASLKMATFYGVYTWLTHSVFGANLIFIPAGIAATLGVVPFIGTYWAAVPATLELWLIQQDSFRAVLLFVLHMMPTYVVDTAIYSEIAGGGHPYLTGLAVAGGVYCIGLEGAFVGPIVLCCLIAAFNAYNGILNEASTEDELQSRIAKTVNRFRRAVSEDQFAP